MLRGGRRAIGLPICCFEGGRTPSHAMPCAKEPPKAMLCYMLKDLLKRLVSFKIRAIEMSNLFESIYAICFKSFLISINKLVFKLVECLAFGECY